MSVKEERVETTKQVQETSMGKKSGVGAPPLERQL